MLKQLTIAAIFVASAAASSANLLDTNTPNTAVEPRKELDSVFGSLVFKSADSKKSSKDSDSDSSSSSDDDKKKTFVMKELPTAYVNHKNAEKKLKKFEKIGKVGKDKDILKKETPFIVKIKRSKNSRKSKNRKSKDSSSKESLSIKPKHFYILNVASDLTNGVEITNKGSTLFKTSGKGARNYAILEKKESYELGVKAMKKRKEGKALMRFEKIRVSSAIKVKVDGKKKKTRVYHIVNAPVVMSDAAKVCEYFDYDLAEVHPEDVEAIIQKATKYVEEGRTEVWIDSVYTTFNSKEEKKVSMSDLKTAVQIPNVLNLANGETSYFAPELTKIQAKIERAANRVSVNGKRDSYLHKRRGSIRKFAAEFKSKDKDATTRRIVLCREK